jgi:hypothetical protein
MIDYSNKQHFFWLSTGTEKIELFINNWLAQILVHFKKNYSFPSGRRRTKLSALQKINRQPGRLVLQQLVDF